MRYFLKVLISIAVIILLCSGAEGRKKNRPKNKKPPSEPLGGLKKEGESCELITGSKEFPWGTCAKGLYCPVAYKLNCANGLHCCRNRNPQSDEDTISEEEYSVYLELRDHLYN